MKKIKLFAIVLDNHAASTQYRLLQYLPFLSQNAIDVTLVKSSSLNSQHLSMIAQSDLVLNQKCLLPKSFSKKIFSANPRTIFDFDDSIYTRPGKPFSFITQWRVNSRFHYWLKNSTKVIPANKHLKNYAERYSKNITVLPMTLDLNIWQPKTKQNSEKITIGWAGAPGNLHHIEKLSPILQQILNKYPHVSLAIYSGKKPNFNFHFDYIPYKPGEEHLFTQSLDIGLLPLSNEEFSKGKSPIKAIQYLACSVPVVGNSWGATSEIINPNNSLEVFSEKEWHHALEKLILDKTLRKQLGATGRRHVENLHDKEKIQDELLAIMRSVAACH